MPERTFRLPWKVVPYIAPSGSSDVLDYLEALKGRKRRSWDHLQIILKEMEQRGPFDLGGQYWEAVGDQLYEISWGRNRAYCSVEGERVVVMYVAVNKLWPKMRSGDRKKCFVRRADFQSAAYDLENREYLYRAHCNRRGKQ
jgi:hypothetical protein